MNDFGSQNGSKMEPKWKEKKWRQPPRGHPKTVWKYRLVFLWFWGAFGRLLAPFSTPFGHPGSLLASLRLPFRHPGSLLASLWMPFGSFWKRLGPPRICRDSAENLPKFSRELAEVQPRIRQEPAKNPPYEPQAKLSSTLHLLRMDCVLRQTLGQNRRG